MEEVRNSDNLKKEILEDARKKAERIVKNAEKQANDIREEWDKKIEEDYSAFEKDAAARISFLEMETMAALPLEKRRIRQNYFTEKFEACLSEFAERIDETEAERIFMRKLHQGAPLLGQGRLSVDYSGLTVEAAKRIVYGDIEETRIASWNAETGPKGIVIRSENGGITFRITMDEVTDELREYHRKEIFEALFKDDADHD